MSEITEIKPFSGQMTNTIATTTDIKEADKLVTEGWKVMDTGNFLVPNNLGGASITTVFVLIKNT